jgi:heat shock protein HslJ
MLRSCAPAPYSRPGNDRSRPAAAIILVVLLMLPQVLWPGGALAATGDISVGGVWVCQLTRVAPGLTLEQRVRQVEQRITDVLSLPELQRRQLTVEVRPAGAAATIVAAAITIMTVTPADAAGTGVTPHQLANQWAGRLVQGLRRALPGRQVIGLMYAQPRGSDPREAGRLVGITWCWRGTLMNDGANFVPADPNRYTIHFTSDGRTAVRADCNRGTGTYVLRGQTIEISRLGMTKAMCPPGSLDQRFLMNLGQVAIYSVRDGVLLLDLKFDSGTMRFSRLLP